MENSEQTQSVLAQKLVQEIKRLLKAMNEALNNTQWQRLRSLDLEMCEAVKLLEQPEYKELKQQLQPLLKSQYLTMLSHIKQQQASLKSRMQQHVLHQDGINSYQDVIKAIR